MDASLVLSIVGIVLSGVATAISSVLVLRQASFQRHANQLPVIINLLQEYRTFSFQESQEYVRKVLPVRYDDSTGVDGLPPEARSHLLRVGGFFSSLGVLVVSGIADEELVVSLLGYPVMKNWEVLEGYILRERELRDDDDFLNFFEDLVCRVRDGWPPVKSYGYKLRKWEIDPSGSPDPTPS